MARKVIGNPLDRDNRNNHNDNYRELYGDIGSIKDIAEEAKEKVDDLENEVKYRKGYLMDNRGADYPLKSMLFNGEKENISTHVKNTILDAKIIGARRGYVYRLTYVANGFTSEGKARYGITMTEYRKDTLATNPRYSWMFVFNDEEMEGNAENANYVKSDDDIDTIVVSNQNITAIITIDRGYLTDNNLQNLTVSTQAPTAFIDETNYVYRTQSTSGSLARLVAAKTGDRTFNVKTTYSDTQNIIFEFGSLGINNITHLKKITLQEKNEIELDGDFSGTVLHSVSSDWLSPYRIEARQNGNGNSMMTTGGNHGTDGAGGFATARPVSCDVYVDGVKLKNGDIAYAAKEVVAVVVNHVSAYNVINTSNGQKRDSLKEIITYTFSEDSVAVNVELEALENIQFKHHQGLGIIKSPWNKTLYYVDDVTHKSTMDVSDNVAGESGTYRDGCRANRAVLRKDGNAVISYIDSDVGLGTLDHHGATNNVLFLHTPTKVYSRLIGLGNTVDVDKGDSLYFSGGYTFTQGLKCEGAEFAHKLSLKGKKAYAVDFFNAVNKTHLEVDPEDVGKKINIWTKSDNITHDDYITSRGLRVSAAGYGQLVFTVD